MDRFFICLAATLLLSGMAATSSTAQTDARIAEIRQLYSTIESGELKRQVIKDPDEAVPTTLTRYSLKNETVKIVLETGSDHGLSTASYYYHEGELFFAYLVDESWRFTGKQKPDGESETIDVRRETRLYFDGKKGIHSLEKEVKDTDPDALRKKIAKEANQSFSDPERVAEARETGEALLPIRSRAELEAYLIR